MSRGRPRNGGELFFTLTPTNPFARDVMAANPEHTVFHAGVYSIGCFLDRASRYPGRLLSFGRNPVHDIILPSVDPNAARPSRTAAKATGGRNHQNYCNDHFFFFLAPSGELILRDLTRCLTQIFLENSSPAESKLYGLRGSNPRQRVIPRNHRPMLLDFGTSTHFRFQWVGTYQFDGQQPELEARGLELQVSGLNITAPASSLRPTTETQSRELRSQYAPSHGSSLAGARTRRIHKYRGLGQGTFGEVSKAVDLADGSLWAVKEIVSGQNDDTWKACFVQEAEMLLRLKHDHIVHFETYQDFNIGGDYQLFFRLYKGSLSALLQQNRHGCESTPRETSSPKLWERLVTQMSSALQYIHNEGVVHRDIKPDNILYDNSPEGDGYDFFLGDFGLSLTQAAIQASGAGGGTSFFNAPEIANTRNPSPASDIWALGVTFGFVLSYWCFPESERSVSFWNRKLAAFGVTRGPYADPAVRRARDVWPHRVAALAVSPLIPPAMSWMLRPSPYERPSAMQLTLTPIGDFTPPPRRRAAGQSTNNSNNTQQRTEPPVAAMDSRTAPPPYPGMQGAQIPLPPQAPPHRRAQPHQAPADPQPGRPQLPPLRNPQMPPPQQQPRQSPWERDPARPLLPAADTMGRHPQLPPLRALLAQPSSNNSSAPDALLRSRLLPPLANANGSGNGNPAGQQAAAAAAPYQPSNNNNSVPRSLLAESSSTPWPQGWQHYQQSLPPPVFSHQGGGARGEFNGRSV